MSRALYGPVADLRDELRTRTQIDRADCVHDPEASPRTYLKVATRTGPARLVVWDGGGFRWKAGGQLGTTAAEAAEAVALELGVPIT